MQPNFKFEDLGIGGLEDKFKSIFWRAFASRIFPAALVDKLTWTGKETLTCKRSLCEILNEHKRSVNICITHSYGCSLMLQTVERCAFFVSFVFFFSPCLVAGPGVQFLKNWCFCLAPWLVSSDTFIEHLASTKSGQLTIRITRSCLASNWDGTNLVALCFLRKCFYWLSGPKWPDLQQIKLGKKHETHKIFAITGKEGLVTLKRHWNPLTTNL